MSHSRQLNQKINKIQRRALRVTYKDTESTFSELLQKDCAVTIHTNNLQILVIEMYQTKNELKLSFMQESSKKIQLATCCEIITKLCNPE